MQVLCVITGLGSVDVTVDENATVATVKEALKTKETTALVNVEAQRLQLFLAKRDGEWLSLDSREITLMYRDLSPLEDLVQQELGADEAVLDMVQPLQPWGTVHFLVMLPTRSIMYLIAGFPGATRMVNVDHDAKISVLTEMLLQDERLPNNKQITLFLAKRNNSWLEYDSKDEAMLALGDVTTNVKGMLTTKAINPDASVDQVFGALPAQRCVHVLVVVLGHKLRGALPGLLGEYKVQMHWDEMNYAFARLKPSANESANLHRITWNDIGHFYTQKEYEEESLQVSDQCFCHVKTKLGQAISTIGGVCSNIEISWVLFTLFASILAAEKTRMKGIKVFGKYPIDNPDGRLSVGGDLDFAITSKTHCVCLMESQRAAQNVQEMMSSDYDTEISSDSSEDDGSIQPGLAQTVLGVELLNARGEGKVVTGIVSNYYSWIFVRLQYQAIGDPVVLTDKVDLVSSVKVAPQDADLKRIVGKIMSLFLSREGKDDEEGHVSP